MFDNTERECKAEHIVRDAITGGTYVIKPRVGP